MSKTAAGIFFYSRNTDRFLYLLRNDKGTFSWGVPGGTVDNEETLLECLKRECDEEIGLLLEEHHKLVPIQKFINNTFTYHTFFCEVDDEFLPWLNNEHLGYAWIDRETYPRPLHPGLFSTVSIDIVKEKLDILTR